MAKHPDRTLETHYDYELEIVVERPLARFSSWYEFFPRSAVGARQAHGTFATAKARLAYVAGMGFDVLYLPPIHPIGATKRKGPNNALDSGARRPGARGRSARREGGHTSVHPKLGTLEDFQAFRAEAERLGIEVALDLAFQCSPDHPYVSERPDWFKRRRDGSVQYAENPPKKYEDIYPFDFASSEWESLWRELRDVVEFWVSQGVSVFRVDNPHTKPFGFWQWLIGDVRSRHPGVIFLAEAFARPRVMYRLAKLGFSQSYTYFTWRNTKPELTDYFTELADRRDYFRPESLAEHARHPARVPAVRRAARVHVPRGARGDSRRELRHLRSRVRAARGRAARAGRPRSTATPRSIRYAAGTYAATTASVSSLRGSTRSGARTRRCNHDANLRFHDVDNEQLICYSKRTEDLDDIVLVVVNLDPHHAQSGFVELPLASWRMDAGKAYQAHDLLSGGRYLWQRPPQLRVPRPGALARARVQAPPARRDRTRLRLLR